MKKPSYMDVATFIVGFSAVLLAWSTLNLQNEQTALEKSQFSIENYPTQIPSIILSDVNLQNLTYKNYPTSEHVSISIVSPHLLKIQIGKIEFANYPPGNYKLTPAISWKPINKYVDKGASNLDFDVPFLLSFDVNGQSPYPANTTWAGIPLSTQIEVIDIQNSSSVIYSDTLHNYLGIKGAYLPKDVLNVDESTKKDIHLNLPH